MAVTYPFSKRFTDFPQLFFGLLVAPACLIGGARFDVSPFISKTCEQRSTNWLRCYSFSIEPEEIPLVLMFVANIVWATLYETIYSFADIADDAAAGVRTITLSIRDHAKLVLAILSFLFISLLISVGITANYGIGYYMTTVLITSAMLAVQITQIDLENPGSCLWWFGHGTKYLGAAFLSGIVAEYLIRAHVLF
ncbi:MAG: hypothetical protein Q9162_003080 [Coniocarpon cinnabarinum]